MKSCTPYGVLPSEFWDDDLGVALQAAGAAPLILYLYLLANRHATMVGLYRVLETQIALELRMFTGEQIQAAFAVLARLDVAFYDPGTQMVWVKDMAGLRLHPRSPEQTIADDDKRLIGVWRQYKELPASPFNGRFFDYYQRRFRMPLPLRRHDTSPSPSPLGSPFTSPLRSPFGRSVDQETGEQKAEEQKSRRVETAESVDAPRPHPVDAVSTGAPTLSRRSHTRDLHADKKHTPKGPHDSTIPLPFGPLGIEPEPAETLTAADLAGVVANQIIKLQRFASFEELVEVTLAYYASDRRVRRDVASAAVRLALEKLSAAGHIVARALLETGAGVVPTVG